MIAVISQLLCLSSSKPNCFFMTFSQHNPHITFRFQHLFNAVPLLNKELSYNENPLSSSILPFSSLPFQLVTLWKKHNFPTRFRFCNAAAARDCLQQRNDSIWLNEIFISHNSRISPESIEQSSWSVEAAASFSYMRIILLFIQFSIFIQSGFVLMLLRRGEIYGRKLFSSCNWMKPWMLWMGEWGRSAIHDFFLSTFMCFVRDGNEKRKESEATLYYIFSLDNTIYYFLLLYSHCNDFSVPHAPMFPSPLPLSGALETARQYSSSPFSVLCSLSGDGWLWVNKNYWRGIKARETRRLSVTLCWMTIAPMLPIAQWAVPNEYNGRQWVATEGKKS